MSQTVAGKRCMYSIQITRKRIHMICFIARKRIKESLFILENRKSILKIVWYRPESIPLNLTRVKCECQTQLNSNYCIHACCVVTVWECVKCERQNAVFILNNNQKTTVKLSSLLLLAVALRYCVSCRCCFFVSSFCLLACDICLWLQNKNMSY